MNTRLLAIWQRMLDVCTDEMHADYAAHGAMGIGVCETWQRDAAAFMAWAEANRYADDRFLVRIRIADDFRPENCWWVDDEVYQRYLQFIRPIPGESAIRPLGDWLTDPRCRVDLPTFTRLLTKGWTVERILMKPPEMRQRGRKYPFAYAEIPIGMVFGRLTVTGHPETVLPPSGWMQHVYPCRCACGTPDHRVYAVNLINGEVVSCGCYKREQQGVHSLVHGDARKSGMSPLYAIWTRIVYACTKPKHRDYPIYGRRGIAVCLAWQMDYTVFRSWALANGYLDGLRIERHDRNGDFTPENCFFTADAPVTTRSRLLTVEGETQSLSEWARDPRCRVSPSTFLGRMARGWQVEDALRIDPRSTTPPPSLTAFGETRSLMAWLQDPRCCVTGKCLQARMRAGWDAERALTTPSRGTRSGIVAFTERKTVAAWARDPRSAVTEGVLRVRLKNGWAAEAAITTPLQSTGQHQEAFGEWKLIAQWAEDPRCGVPRQTLYSRIQAGWALEDALTTPAGGRTQLYAAFGEQKVLTQWAKDRRCGVPFTTLNSRIQAGWTLEEALTTPARGRHPQYTAFGEEKLLKQWAMDSRCCVPFRTLYSRVKAGWPFTDALTTAGGVRRHTQGKTKPVRAGSVSQA